MTPLNAFTVDVEDYFQVSGFERQIPRETWGDFPSRVVASTQAILRLLERRQVHGTFFILGWTAERHPDLVREIHRAGHEVGSHSYWHRLVYELTPDEFRADLRRSRDVLEQVIGEPVTAYRAPSFSITQRSLWALDILVEEGLTVDSSIFPIYHDRYGMPNAEPGIHELQTPHGALREFPPSIAKWGPWNLPVAGGGYFRLYPWWFTRHFLRQINRRAQRPFMFYVHPWEVDPEQPRLSAGTRGARFRHYVNQSSTLEKLDRLCRDFPLGRMCDVMSAAGQPTRRVLAC